MYISKNDLTLLILASIIVGSILGFIISTVIHKQIAETDNTVNHLMSTAKTLSIQTLEAKLDLQEKLLKQSEESMMKLIGEKNCAQTSVKCCMKTIENLNERIYELSHPDKENNE